MRPDTRYAKSADGAGIPFADRGTQALKGIPGSWRLCAVAVTTPG